MSEPPIVPDADPGPEITGWHDSDVSGDRINLHEGPIVAGDPEGARVEVTETGLRAYDSTGTETASIAGEGGEFVGGSFRTSDTLPGQVTISDTGYADPVGNGPGIQITPLDTDGVRIPPAIGPNPNGMILYGGQSAEYEAAWAILAPQGVALAWENATGDGATVQVADLQASVGVEDATGRWVGMQATENDARIQAVADDGSYGWVRVTPRAAELASVGILNTYESQILADENEAFLFTRAGGVRRFLSVDATGIWVKSGSDAYNLEETAQDSGWQTIPTEPGFTGSTSLAWRNKGGVIWFRGTVTGDWVAGWNTFAANAPTEIRPAYGYTVIEAGGTEGARVRMQVDGRIQVYAPTAGTATFLITSLSYPTG